MSVEKLIPMLYANEIQVTVDFYLKILGFSCNANKPGDGWASLQLDNVEIMLAIPKEHISIETPLLPGRFILKQTGLIPFGSNLGSARRSVTG